MVFQVVHRHVGTTGRAVRTECLTHDLTSHGFTEGMLREAIDNWVSLRVMAGPSGAQRARGARAGGAPRA
eukprot:2338429-Lingulodinium_polyedra.AAC.1